jgi:hypothetical protein
VFTFIARHKPAVVAGGFAALLLLLVVGATAWDLSRRGKNSRVPADTPKQVTGNPLARGDKRIFSRQEFEKEVLGLHTVEVRSLLGAPDSVETSTSGGPGDEGYWLYRARTLDPATGKPDDHPGAILSIMHDKVVQVQY